MKNKITDYGLKLCTTFFVFVIFLDTITTMYERHKIITVFFAVFGGIGAGYLSNSIIEATE